MNFRFCLLLLFIICPVFAQAEEITAPAAANTAASKVVIDPAAKEDAKTIVDSAKPVGSSDFQQEMEKQGLPPKGALESGTNSVVKTEAKIPQKVIVKKDKDSEQKTKQPNWCYGTESGFGNAWHAH